MPAEAGMASERVRSGKASVRIEASAIQVEARSPGYRETLLDAPAWNRTEFVEESGETASTSSQPDGDSAEPADEAFLEQLQRRRSGETGSSQETQRSVMVETQRNDTTLPKADTALASASIPRPAVADNPGMNELPPEMKDLQLSPRAGHAAWGREMGERIGFLLHNKSRQAGDPVAGAGRQGAGPDPYPDRPDP